MISNAIQSFCSFIILNFQVAINDWSIPENKCSRGAVQLKSSGVNANWDTPLISKSWHLFTREWMSYAKNDPWLIGSIECSIWKYQPQKAIHISII